MPSISKATTSLSRLRVVYLTNVPTPYKISMLNSLSLRIAEFRALFLSATEYMRSWALVLESARFKYVVCRSLTINLRRLENPQHISIDALLRAFRLRPDLAIIGPYSQATLLAAFILYWILHVPVIIWFESHGRSSISPSRIKRIGSHLKHWVLHKCAAVVVPGRLAHDYALSLGIKPEKIFVAPHSVDNQFYAEAMVSPSRNASIELEATLKKIAPYEKILLYVGQFISRKNLEFLTRNFSEIKGELNSCCLLLVGHAGDKSFDMEDIYTCSHLQQADIAKLYHHCHGLILPSTHEVWGLVVNEAAACGLPVIVSRQCGASEVAEAIGGYVFDAYDSESLKRSLRSWYQGLGIWDRKSTSTRLAEGYNFEKMSDGFLSAIEFSTSTQD